MVSENKSFEWTLNDLNARVDMNFARVICKFSKSHCDLILK